MSMSDYTPLRSATQPLRPFYNQSVKPSISRPIQSSTADSIKCSDCSELVPLILLTEHVCLSIIPDHITSPPITSPPITSPPTTFNSTTSPPTTSNRDIPQIKMPFFQKYQQMLNSANSGRGPAFTPQSAVTPPASPAFGFLPSSPPFYSTSHTDPYESDLPYTSSSQPAQPAQPASAFKIPQSRSHGNLSTTSLAENSLSNKPPSPLGIPRSPSNGAFPSNPPRELPPTTSQINPSSSSTNSTLKSLRDASVKPNSPKTLLHSRSNGNLGKLPYVQQKGPILPQLRKLPTPAPSLPPAPMSAPLLAPRPPQPPQISHTSSKSTSVLGSDPGNRSLDACLADLELLGEEVDYFPDLDSPVNYNVVPKTQPLNLKTPSHSSGSRSSASSAATSISSLMNKSIPRPQPPSIPLPSTPSLSNSPPNDLPRATKDTCTACSMSVSKSESLTTGDDQIFCKPCYAERYLPKCRKCTLPIEGGAVTSSDGKVTGKFHPDCFSCFTCSTSFPDMEFYVFDHKPYCQHHYHELNGSLCANATCGRPIEGPCVSLVGEENGGGGRYHPEHFVCSHKTCRVPLLEHHFVVRRQPYCERHADMYAGRSNGSPAANTPAQPSWESARGRKRQTIITQRF